MIAVFPSSLFLSLRLSSSIKKVETGMGSVRAANANGDDDDGVVAREVVSPPQYFLLGFKDRSLEAEYLEWLVCVSKAKVILGLVVALLLFIVCYFFFNAFTSIVGVENYWVSTHTAALSG